MRTRKQRNVIEVATTISSWPFAFFFQLKHHEPRERSELLKLRRHRKLNLIVKAEEFAEESMGLDTDSFFCPQRQANFGLFQAVDTFL